MFRLEIVYHSGQVVLVETGRVQRYYVNGQTGASRSVEGLGCDNDFIEHCMQHGQPLRITDPKGEFVERIVDMHNVREVRNITYGSASEPRTLSPVSESISQAQHSPPPAAQLLGQDTRPPDSVGTA